MGSTQLCMSAGSLELLANNNVTKRDPYICGNSTSIPGEEPYADEIIIVPLGAAHQRCLREIVHWLQPVQDVTRGETVMHASNGAACPAHSELPYLKQEVKKSTMYHTVFHSW